MIEMLREGKRERDRKRDTQERKRRWEKMKVMSSYISFFLSFLSLFLFNPIRTGEEEEEFRSVDSNPESLKVSKIEAF